MASGIHTLSAMLLSTAQDAKYRSIAHLRMWVASHSSAHDFFDVWPELRSPAQHAFRWPVTVFDVRLGSVLRGDDGCALRPVATPVRGDAHAGMP